MADRENVIKELQGLSGSKETMNLISDAIALLKEHEAVKPIFIQTTRTRECGLMEVSIKCGNCKSKVQYYPERWKYCPNCGRKVNWND